MKEREDEYCGMACDFLLEDQQKILDICIEHAKYDPVFAPIMIDKLIAKCMEAKGLLLTVTTTKTATTATPTPITTTKAS